MTVFWIRLGRSSIRLNWMRLAADVKTLTRLSVINKFLFWPTYLIPNKTNKFGHLILFSASDNPVLYNSISFTTQNSH